MRNCKMLLIMLVVHTYIDISYSQVLNSIIRLQNVDVSGFIMIEDVEGVETRTIPTFDEASVPPTPFLPVQSSQSYIMTWRVNWGAANRGGSFIAADDENYKASGENRYLCLEGVNSDGVRFVGIKPLKLKPKDENQRQKCLWRFVPRYDPINYVNNYQLTLPDNSCVEKSEYWPQMYCLVPALNCSRLDPPRETLFKVLQNNF